MLILSRKTDETIIIDGHIKIMIVRIQGDVVKVGIEAPREVTVDRGEVHKAKGSK
jgi:carbon storage regulator